MTDASRKRRRGRPRKADDGTEKKYSCPDCDYRTNVQINVNNHRRTHAKEETESKGNHGERKRVRTFCSSSITLCYSLALSR